VAEALARECLLVQPLPDLHEPFDCVVARRVSRDCLVSFEGRRYSLPFRWLGRLVEVRGTAQHVVIYADGAEVARHPRHTARRLLVEPAHYEGPSSDAVLAPPPLGARGRLQLATWSTLPDPGRRPLAAYVTLVERLLQ
jgi:hypothetical protein